MRVITHSLYSNVRILARPFLPKKTYLRWKDLPNNLQSWRSGLSIVYETQKANLLMDMDAQLKLIPT